MASKRGVQLVFALYVSPRIMCYRVANRILGRRAFSGASESIARIPGLRGVLLRQAFYRNTLANCGQDVYFGWMSAFSMDEARVGNRTYIGRCCSIGFADIRDEVMLADQVQILSGGNEHGHSHDGGSMQSQPQDFRRVCVGRGAWIGAGSVVMADVGEGSIVGAGSVVNRPIPPHSVAVGVPAQVIRSLRAVDKEV